MAPRALVILGSTGSLGRQALEVAEAYPDQFTVVGLAAHSNWPLLARQIQRHHPRLVSLSDGQATRQLAHLLGDRNVEVLEGQSGIIAVAQMSEADVVIAALSGSAGFWPTIAAIRAAPEVILANKETLVMGGRLVLREAQRCGTKLIPVDSEHSGLFQILRGLDATGVRRVILTASGGPFASQPELEFESVTPEQALKHPSWKLGKRLGIDCATLMNKGLEVIEAHWWFGLEPERIEVVIHPESVVHAIVEYPDGSMIAQLAKPDMRLPILYALVAPDRWDTSQFAGRLDLTEAAELHFRPVNFQRFPCLRLAYQVLTQGGIAPAVLNAADEAAVSAFLNGEITFNAIPVYIERALAEIPVQPADDFAAVFKAHEFAMNLVQSWIRADSTKR